MTREEAKQKMISANNSQDTHRLHGLGVIAKIYDDLEYKICKNCKFVDDRNDGIYGCFKLMCKVDEDFGCNKWEKKID